MSKRHHISITLNGGEKLMTVLDRLGDTVERDVAIQIAASAFRIEQQAKADVPVDTGALRDSIHVRFYEGGQVATVSTPMPRARPNEKRTPFLRPAYNQERAGLLARIRGILRRDIAQTGMGK